MALLDDIESRLSSQSVAGAVGSTQVTDTGWTITKGWMPADPDRVITLYETGGLRPEAKPEVDYPTFQVRVRGGTTQYSTAAEKLDDIERALHGANGLLYAETTATNRYYPGIWAQSGPLQLGVDGQDTRPLLAQNFRAARSRTTQPVFSPSDLSSLVAWYRADTLTGLNDGDPVATWTDDSGNGYDLTQSTPSQRPLWRTNIQNSLAVVRFDGTDDLLSNAAFVDFGDTYSLAIAAAFGGPTAGRCLLTVSVGAGDNTGFLLFNDGTNNTWRGVDAAGTQDVLGGDYRDSAWRLHLGLNSGSLLTYRVNAASVGTAAYTAPNPNTLDTLTLSTLPSGPWPFSGDVGEIILDAAAWDATTIGKVETYLNNRWAVY